MTHKRVGPLERAPLHPHLPKTPTHLLQGVQSLGVWSPLPQPWLVLPTDSSHLQQHFIFNDGRAEQDIPGTVERGKRHTMGRLNSFLLVWIIGKISVFRVSRPRMTWSDKEKAIPGAAGEGQCRRRTGFGDTWAEADPYSETQRSAESQGPCSVHIKKTGGVQWLHATVSSGNQTREGI